MHSIHEPGNQAQMWRVPDWAGVSFLRADFTTHAFDRHTHGQYLVGVIQRGVQRVYHQGGHHLCPTGHLLTLNPDEVHDGQAETPGGYAYQAVYLEPELAGRLAGLPQAPVFGHGVTPPGDDLGWRLLAALAACAPGGAADLEAEQDLYQVLALVLGRHARPLGPGREPGHRPGVERAREFLRDMAAQRPSLEQAAAVAGLSKYHFLRVFKAEMGLSPGDYLNQCKVERARGLLDRGQTPAQAAAAAGFADQSHLIRRFKAIYGLTPGAYLRSLA